jgi:predicted nucleic acid-binding protein
VKGAVLVDTGPLVAFLSANDAYHGWVVERWQDLRPPLLTCEAVLSEAVFLLQRKALSERGLVELVERGLVRLDFSLAADIAAVATLLRRYADVPMSLADACLVRMSEVYSDSRMFTLDSDFKLYRRLGRRAIAAIAPW